MKKISIGTKPTNKAENSQKIDEWVDNKVSSDDKKMKRLTIDIPENLHREIKSQCAKRGVKIADEIREMLLKKYTV